MANLARGAWSAQRRLSRVETFHVRSHTGEPGNECADVLAELDRQGMRGSSSLVDKLLQCVHQRVARKPQVLDLYSILYWSRVLDRNVGAQPVQTKEDRAESDGKVIRLKLGTANVTSLYPREEGSVGVSNRRLQLAQQFRKEGYQVLGLQETRVRSFTQFRSEEWLVWTAAAEAGRSGVEVWLDEGLGIDARNVTIAIENTRCLPISVPFLGRRTLFVSAHGPVADTEEEQIRLWWDTLASEVAAVAQDQNVVLLIDANASLNDEAGIHCGGSEATKENVASTALKELVAEGALCIPQTFSKFGPTWRNRRLDFIAVPLEGHAAVSDIKVEPPELLAINDFVDHRAVKIMVTLRWEKCQSRERRLNFERAS